MGKGRGSSSTAGGTRGTTEAFKELFVEECLTCECLTFCEMFSACFLTSHKGQNSIAQRKQVKKPH